MMRLKPIYALLLILISSSLVLFGCKESDHTETAVSTQPDTLTTTESETNPATEADTEIDADSEMESTTGVSTDSEMESTTENTTAPETEAATETPTVSEIEAATEAPTVPETEPPTEALLTIDAVAFIGDSRTLTMAAGGRYEFGLIPSSSVFATWGGELTQDSAKNNALSAAAADRRLAIFWYGINDVQSDPEQTLAAQFIANYQAVIDLYRANNPDSDIVILSILSTSVHEKDYYAGQEENIRTYNVALSALCAQEGHTYLDITALFTGDECLAPGDYIHFSKEWYEEKFLPTVFQTLGIIS